MYLCLFQEMFAGRNKSEITYDTCFKWTCIDESPQSGFAMLVLDIPSGYNNMRRNMYIRYDHVYVRILHSLNVG